MSTDIVPVAADALVPHDMDQAIRLAQAMSSAKLVPRHLQGDVGSCLMVVEQAMRWHMSPFAVAQCTSAIGGKLMFEGKLVAAAVESSGAIEGHFDFEYAGEGDDRQVTVKARRVGETNPRQLTIHLRDVRTNNEWWKKQPDQQLAYSGVRNWARRYTPAALLGVYAPEEVDRRTGTTIEGEKVIETPAPEPPQRATAQQAAGPYAQQAAQYEAGPPPRPSPARPDAAWRAWLDKLHQALAPLRTEGEIAELGGRRTVLDALEHGPEWVKQETQALLAEAYDRVQAVADDAAEAEIPFDDVKIAGEEKLGAG